MDYMKDNGVLVFSVIRWTLTWTTEVNCMQCLFYSCRMLHTYRTVKVVLPHECLVFGHPVSWDSFIRAIMSRKKSS